MTKQKAAKGKGIAVERCLGWPGDNKYTREAGGEGPQGEEKRIVTYGTGGQAMWDM